MIPTRFLMAGSAVLLTAAGLSASFLPQEILALVGVTADRPQALLIQLGGAALMGFALLNWMARGVIIGGIYARPLALGNFLMFLMAAMATLRWALHDPAAFSLLAALLLCVFAAAFGFVLFSDPLRRQEQERK